MTRKILLLFLFYIINNILLGQVNGPPVPCTTGAQNTCKCNTSPILCTINDLNGYEYDMTTFQHPADGPQPMCPPPEGNGTVSNNPTWFAFLSWCTNLTIKVTYTNCTNPPGPSNGGIQAAVYSGCPATTNNAIACDTDLGGCNGDGERILNITGMIPGNIYYFLVDGCAGSACHIKITVIGACSQTEPSPWSAPLAGPNVLCKPNASGVFSQIKNESTYYYWYIDGNLVTQGNFLISTTLNFNNLSNGMHTVCIDGALPPCVPVTSNPPPNCKQVCIAPEPAEAGTINANSPVCPGTTVPVSITGINTSQDFTNHVFITNSSGVITDILPSGTTNFNVVRSNCDQINVWSYNYYNICYANPILPVVGNNVSTIQDSCKTCGCELTSKIISWQDNVAPVFSNPPANQTFACYIAAPPLNDLNYTDNCLPPGSVPGTETGSANPCDGGTVTRTWTITDSCGNTRTHNQTLTFGSVPIANWVNPPADITIACSSQIPTNNNLNYTNGGTPPCLISGTAQATVTENWNNCDGGTVTKNWQFTDACGRNINHTQTITISPSVLPAFTNPPPDITVNCNSVPSAPGNLSYTNGMPSTCLIAGSVQGTIEGPSPTICGGDFFFKWTFTDNCNRTITHIQKITVIPVPEGNFVNPPNDITVECNMIPTSGQILTFTNGLSGPCQITANVTPTQGGNGNQCGGTMYFAWSYTDVCNRTKVDTQFITINPIPDPYFINPPADITVSCENRPTGPLPTLSVSNGSTACPINAVVTATQTGSANECGGEITYNWNYIDICSRVISHQRKITVLPMPQGAFVNPPPNITVNCNQVPTNAPNLQIKNTGTGSCLIDQSVTPTQSGTANECGGMITYTWTHTDQCNRTTTHTQTVTVIPILAPSFVNPPADITVTCDQIPATGINLLATNNDPHCPINQTVVPTTSGNADICGGTKSFNWTFTDQCNRTISHTQNVTVIPMPPANFVNPPADITVTCDQIPTSAPNLQVVNNGPPGCNINQTVSPTQSGNATVCGGTITYTWTFTDQCNRTITHVQNITVTPMPPAVFINPPADQSVTCDQIPTSAPSLQVKNNGPAGCNIDQFVTPVQSGNGSICGGTITFTWTFTDQCNRTISHTQNITIIPMPLASFVNPPADITITCDQIPTAAPTLQVKNNGPAGCNIDQQVTAVVSGNATVCGGTLTNTWTFTDQCNRTITHVQNITVTPMPPPQFVNPPANITVSCNEIPTQGAILTVINNGPPGCNINTTVSPTQSGSANVCGGTISYTWVYTDLCNRTITHTQSVIVTPMPAPQFVNPPANITVNCNAIPSNPPDLQVTNNGPTGCQINETVPATIEGNPNPCGGSFNYKWTFTDICGRTISHTQSIFVNPTPAASFVNPPVNELVSCENVPPANSYPSLTITNGLTGICGINDVVNPVITGSANACGGTINVTWTHTDFCGRTISHVKIVTVSPAPQAVFATPPPDITVNCNQVDNNPINLAYTNNSQGNCLIQGSVTNIRVGTVTSCGGNLIDTWTFTDACGRTITKSRTITVNPAPKAAFINPPNDLTVNCTDVALTVYPLSYDNNQTGNCSISGSVMPTQSGSYDECGGIIQLTWTFTDACNRSISHTQKITVRPAPDPYFVDPPQNADLGCGGENNPPPTIPVSNGLTGPCGININAPLVSVVKNGNSYTNKWEYVHPCNNKVFTHTQITTVVIAPKLFIDPDEVFLCPGDSFDLTTISITDLNNTNPIITYHSTTPANPSNEIASPIVKPNSGDVYYILGVNAVGCTDEATVYFNIPNPPNAGGNGSTKVCNDGTIYNLNSLLNNGAKPGGSWVQVNGSNINLSNPNAVSFNNIPPLTYTLLYIVQGAPGCANDTASFKIEVFSKVTLSLADIKCNIGGTYEVKVITNATNIVSSHGLTQKLTNDTVRFYNIVQGQNIIITASNINNVCQSTLSILAPDCSCPFVPLPSGTPNYNSCESATLSLPMTVTVAPGLEARWYLTPTGGTSIASNTLTYNHTIGTPGLYKYYVETFNPSNGCISLARFEITVEVFSNPVVSNFVFELCDELGDSKELFDLNSIHSSITSLANSISFHLNPNDAKTGLNPLTNPYQNITNPQKIYSLVTSSVGCKSFGEVDLVVVPLPNPTLTIKDEQCLGNSDGSLTIGNVQPGYTFKLNNEAESSNPIFNNLNAGNYILVTKDNKGCKKQDLFIVKPGMILFFDTFKAECDNKGTLSDPSDDIYKITIKVFNNLNLPGSYRITTSSGFTNTYTYGNTFTFTIPANGNILEVVAKDIIRNCEAKRTVGPLNPCSTTCTIDLTIISSVCNGNNTPSDPSDDFYVLSFSATSQNGASNNKYNLYVSGILKGVFTYGQTNTINIPATNKIENIKVEDNEDVQCSDNLDIGPLNNCSNQCILNTIIESIECKNPGGTPSPSDDFYEIVIKATLINGGSSTKFKILSDDGKTFNGAYSSSVKITLPADNLARKLTIIDEENASCKTVLNLNPLTPCSGACEVIIDIIDVKCSNNSTTNISTDDTYEISINVKLINGGLSDSYKAIVDGKEYNGLYNNVLKITIPADGKAHTIFVEDLLNSLCKASKQTDLLLPCSTPCNLNATIVTFDCNNGGTISDNTDDSYKVTIKVNISGGGNSTNFIAKVDGKEYTGEYGKDLIIPFPADNKIHVISIIDKLNNACLASLNTPILAPCSGPCEIEVAISNIRCNNSGTNNTALDDVFFFDILVTGNNSKWKIESLNAEGAVGNKITLGPFKIKDAIDKFLVYYENSPNCKKDLMIDIPPTCSECKQKVDAGNGGQLSCTQNNITLSGTSTEVGSYSWFLGNSFVANGQTISVGQPGKYFFVAKYADGCEARDSVIVTIDSDLPTVTISRDHQINCEVKEVTISATATGSNLKYEWTNEAGVILGTGLSIKVNKEGKYYFRAYNELTGCSSSKIVSEVIKNTTPPSAVIYAKPSTVFDCVIKVITLFNDNEKNVNYIWKTSDGEIRAKSLEITKIGTYNLTAIDTITGCLNENKIVINSLIEYPIINLTLNDSLDCLTEKVFISAQGSQTGGNIKYEWKDDKKKIISDDEKGIDVSKPGTYFLVLTDINNGCTNEDTIVVPSYKNELNLNIPAQVYVTAGDSVRLNLLLNIPDKQIKKIKWTPITGLSCSDCKNPIAKVDEDSEFKVDVEDIYGCVGQAKVRLIITKKNEVNIPNVISIGSESNNGFTLYGNDQVKLIKSLKIFDRWGNLMFVNKNFEPNKPELGWNGKFNNVNVEQGVYAFVFEVEINAIGIKVFAGDVTVLR